LMRVDLSSRPASSICTSICASLARRTERRSRRARRRAAADPQFAPCPTRCRLSIRVSGSSASPA
jgi:hypothetical protein